MTEGKPAKARRFELIEELFAHNKWDTSALAARFHITPNLLSNDLKALENLGLVVRTRGRARWAPLSTGDLFGTTLFQRQWSDSTAWPFREAIAEHITDSLVLPGTLFLDEGVIPALVARCLAQRAQSGVHLVTTNLAVPAILAHVGIPLPCDLLAGRVEQDPMCVVPTAGDPTIGEGFAPSVAVVTPHAVSAEGDLYVTDRLFSPIKEQMLRTAGRVILAVEGSQVGCPGGFLLAKGGEIRDWLVPRAYLVTDSRLAEAKKGTQLQKIWGERMITVKEPTAGTE
jgi:DeoR/GlpR family transcriptional regulator of sugar metabolism